MAKERQNQKAAKPENKQTSRPFTVKQQEFIDCYAGDCKEAAKKAKISYGYARQLLTKSNILEAIRNRQDTEIRPKTIKNRQQRQEFWSKVMDNENENMHNRFRASELLGISEADFVKHLKIDSEEALTDEKCEEIRELLRWSFEK